MINDEKFDKIHVISVSGEKLIDARKWLILENAKKFISGKRGYRKIFFWGKSRFSSRDSRDENSRKQSLIKSDQEINLSNVIRHH